MFAIIIGINKDIPWDITDEKNSLKIPILLPLTNLK